MKEENKLEKLMDEIRLWNSSWEKYNLEITAKDYFWMSDLIEKELRDEIYLKDLNIKLNTKGE